MYTADTTRPFGGLTCEHTFRMRAPVSTMQAPVFGGFMRVVSKRGHVTHGPASILQAPVFGGFMRVVIGRGYETHGPTPPRRADPVWVRQGGSCSLWCMRGRCRGLGFSPRWLALVALHH